LALKRLDRFVWKQYMQYILFWRRHTRSLASALLLLGFVGAAHDADTYIPSTKQLTIPSGAIGLATYANIVVTVAHWAARLCISIPGIWMFR
jgi:hypothetical protein